MEIYYQGTDITDMVQVNSCIVRDTASGRCDSLEIEFGNAAGWYSWGPEEDDVIVVSHNGYDSGMMYVNKILPANGNYSILAASLPCSARKKEYRSFYEQSIEDIMRICAARSGMEYKIFGLDAGIIIPYIEQENEGCASFLNKLLTLESAALKAVNGSLTAISYAYAQSLDPKQTIELSAGQDGVRYRRDGTTYKSLTVKTPYAMATAVDSIVSGKHLGLTIGHYPAMSNLQAARWARGKLLYLNRQCESVVIRSGYNPGITALIRIDIEGDTDASGEWLVDEVEHDLKNLTTVSTLRRCNYSIGGY